MLLLLFVFLLHACLLSASPRLPVTVSMGGRRRHSADDIIPPWRLGGAREATGSVSTGSLGPRRGRGT